MASGTYSAKWNPRLTHVILALVGMTGLVLFILACRPSWSPDGRKVLYIYLDEGAQRNAVAEFDRKTRTTRVVYESSHEGGADSGIVAAQWAKDGEAIIIANGDDEGEVQVLALPKNALKPVRAYTVKKMKDLEGLAFFPFPQIGNQLFMGGPNERVRINLETGEIIRKEDPIESTMIEAGSKLIYFRRITEKVAEQGDGKSGQQEQKEETVAYEVGEIDQKDLNLHATQRFPITDLKGKGIGIMSGMLDADPASMKLAMAVAPEENAPESIAVIGKDGVGQVLDVGLQGKTYELGNVQWSRDHKVIYVSALIQDKKTERGEFAVIELAIDGKGRRIDRIDERPMKEMGSDYLGAVQIALSPEGKLIAASTGQLENVRPERKGLFLLDVSEADRPVNFYPAPALPALPEAKKE